MVVGRNFGILWLLILYSISSGIQQAHADNMKCLACHSAPSIHKTTENRDVSLHVDRDELAASVHSSKDCLDCHVDLRNQPLPHKQEAAPVQCARCHHGGNNAGAPVAQHVDGYADSVHGSAAKQDDPDAPACQDCHGGHGIRPASDVKSLVHRLNIPSTCGKCHFDSSVTKRHHLANVGQYKESVHAKVVQQKLETAAVCTDCHGVHDIKAHGKPESSVSKPHVPETCGKCHKKIYEEYRQSIHGKAVVKGIKDAPVCTDCHGEHGIQKHTTPNSSVYPTHVAATCSKCHEDVPLQERYGLSGKRMSTYMGSFHGIASKYGDISVANCATCHGAHDIRPSSDPESAISKVNLPNTCGKCHPGAGENFAKGSIHLLPSRQNDASAYWVRIAYILFVVMLIGSFCACIVLDLLARWRKRRDRRRKGDH